MASENVSPFGTNLGTGLSTTLIDMLAQLAVNLNKNEAQRAPVPLTHWWHGASGRGYLHSIYSIHAIPDWVRACNYMFVRVRFDGTREPLYIGQSGELDERLERHEKLGPALMLGATEIHIHLQAQSRQERLDIETDLRHSYVTLLNEQPKPASVFGDEFLAALNSLLNPAPLGTLGALNSNTVLNDLLRVLGTSR